MLALLNCKKEEAPPEKPEISNNDIYFSIMVADEYIPENIEEWIIINDKNGNLLDYRQLANGSTTEFKALENEIPNQFTITTFRRAYLPSLNISRFFLTTYPNIAKESFWNLEYFPSTPREVNPTVPGSFSLFVENVPNYIDYTLSSLESISPVRSYYLQRGSNSLSLPEIHIYQQNRYILTIVDGLNNVKYKIFENTQDGQNLILDYNDFSFFENYLTISLPNQEIDYLYLINGLSEDVAYVGNDGFAYHQNFISSEDQLPFGQLKIGYLDIFDKHKIFFSIDMLEDSYSYQYLKNGRPTFELAIPEKPDFNFQGESVLDFQFSADINYVYSSSQWITSENIEEQSQDQTAWTIFTEFNSITKLKEFPSEIIAQYPRLSLDNLQYQSTSLNLKSESYPDFIDRSFTPKESIGNTDYEKEILTIKNPTD